MATKIEKRLTQSQRDTKRFRWLEDNEADLITRREAHDEEYFVLWWVAKDGQSISGHPLGSPRDAIDYAMKLARKIEPK